MLVVRNTLLVVLGFYCFQAVIAIGAKKPSRHHYPCGHQISMLAVTDQRLEFRLPEPNQHNRYATLNQMGFSDPASNVVIDEYIEWAAERAKYLQHDFSKQGHVLEIGAGFGFTAKRVIERGAFCLINDLSEEHLGIAETLFPEPVHPSQWELVAGNFPYNSQEIWSHCRQKRIVGVGAFMVLHFMKGQQIIDLFKTVYRLTVPGARIFITGGTPYNGLFKKLPRYYSSRIRQFRKNPVLMPFPGEVFNAYEQLGIIPNVLESYKKQYPNFFHALDPEVLEYWATHHPEYQYRLVKKYAIRRPNPPEQSYRRGYSAGKTELMGIILERL